MLKGIDEASIDMDTVTETYRTLGKLEAKMELFEAEMKDQSKKLDHVAVFIDEARGAKKAVIAMWFVAAAVGGAITTVLSQLMGYIKAH